jgi:hypothetical protein
MPDVEVDPLATSEDRGSAGGMDAEIEVGVISLLGGGGGRLAPVADIGVTIGPNGFPQSA